MARKCCFECGPTTKCSIFTLHSKNSKVYKPLVELYMFDDSIGKLKICERHYEEADMKQRKNGKELKPEARDRMPPKIPSPESFRGSEVENNNFSITESKDDTIVQDESTKNAQEEVHDNGKKTRLRNKATSLTNYVEYSSDNDQSNNNSCYNSKYEQTNEPFEILLDSLKNKDIELPPNWDHMLQDDKIIFRKKDDNAYVEFLKSMEFNAKSSGGYKGTGPIPEPTIAKLQALVKKVETGDFEAQIIKKREAMMKKLQTNH